MIGFRLAGHRLEPRASAPELVAVAAAVGGIQAQVMSAAELSLGARVDGITRADVVSALWEDRTLVKTWAMRGTLHLLPAADLPLFMAACGSRPAGWWGAWEKELGISHLDFKRLIEAIGDALDGKRLTRRELIEAVLPRLGGSQALRAAMESGWGSLLKPAARAGHLCFGPSRGPQVTFVRPDQWLGGWARVDELAAGAELLRRYLAVNAPATREDFGRWLGMTPIVRQAWDDVLPEMIRVEGGHALPGYRELPAPSGCVRLLPNFDTLLLSHARREYLVGGDNRARVYRTAGWVSAVVLVDGAIAGTWQLDRGTVRIEEFRPLTAKERRGLDQEVERLGRFLGASVTLG